MATSCSITANLSDGTLKTIYCHFDGYPAWAGSILKTHYTTQELVDSLISGGHISSLGSSTDKPEGHAHDTPVSGYTVYYIRDRGDDEKLNAPTELSNMSQVHKNWQDYNYYWNGENWLLIGRDNKRNLSFNEFKA
ncbi:TPA: hypothetical protein ACVTEY_000144 [Salmonella enterica subsp. enterica]